MAAARSIFTKLGFQVDGTGLRRFNESVGRTKKSMTVAARQANAARRSLNQVAFAAKAAAAGFIAGRIVKAFTTDYSEAADKIAKFAKATGISTRTYQGLTTAVQLSGGDVEALNKGFIALSKRAFDVADGNKTMQRAFRQAGVDVKDSSGALKSQDQILFDLADRFKAMEDGTKKTGLAATIFGAKVGLKMVPMLNEGSKGLQEMIKQSDQLGGILGKKALQDAENFNDEMLRAKMVFTGVRNQIAARLLPVLTRGLKRFQEWAREGDNLAVFLERLKLAALAAAAALGVVVTAKIVGQIQTAVQAIGTLIGAYRAMGAAALLAQAKMMLIPLAIASIVLAIRELWLFAQGKDSVVNRFVGSASEANALRSVLLDLGASMRDIWESIRPAVDELRQAFGEAFGSLREALGPIFTIVKQLLKAGFWLILKALVIQLKILGKIIKIWAFMLKLLIQLLKLIVRFINPALAEMGSIAEDAAELAESAWGGALSGIRWLVEGIALIWDKVTSAAVSSAETVGGAFKFVLEKIRDFIRDYIIAPLKWVGTKMGEAWDFVTRKTSKVSGFEKFGKDVEETRKSIDRFMVQPGQQVAPTAPPAAGTAGGPQAALGPRTVNTSVGSVNVTVQGSVDMDGPAFAEATSRAVRRGINNALKETAQSRTEVVVPA